MQELQGEVDKRDVQLNSQKVWGVRPFFPLPALSPPSPVRSSQSLFLSLSRIAICSCRLLALRIHAHTLVHARSDPFARAHPHPHVLHAHTYARTHAHTHCAQTLVRQLQAAAKTNEEHARFKGEAERLDKEVKRIAKEKDAK